MPQSIYLADSSIAENIAFGLPRDQIDRVLVQRAAQQAQVLVFDEATSALDTATEQSVMAAIEGLSRELTIVLIAHRLSTVERCDRVIRLDRGGVINDGPLRTVLTQA